jgi:hypothetical protein
VKKMIVQRASLLEQFLAAETLALVFPYQRAEYKQAYLLNMHSEQVDLAPFLLLFEFQYPQQHCEDNVYLRLPVAEAACRRNHGVAAVCTGLLNQQHQ